VHRPPACAHYLALLVHGLRTAGQVYGSLLAATSNVGTLPHCRALGLSVLEISVAAGTGADVMAGGAGAAGPTPDVRHQPQGYPDLLQYNLGYPGLSWVIPKRGLSRDILGYLGITRHGVYPMITRGNPA